MRPDTQPTRALVRANFVRAVRVTLGRQIARGELPAAMVILHPPAGAESWPVASVLTRQRRWGDQRARNLLSRLEIRENKPLGELTERQRRVLADALSRRGAGR